MILISLVRALDRGSRPRGLVARGLSVALDVIVSAVAAGVADAAVAAEADQFGCLVADDLRLSLGNQYSGLFVFEISTRRLELNIGGVLLAVGSGLIGVNGGAESVSVGNVFNNSFAAVFVAKLVGAGGPAFAALLASRGTARVVLFVVTELVVSVTLKAKV